YSAFKKDISPGEKECCHYTNIDCNLFKNRMDSVRLHVCLIITRINDGHEITRFSVTLPAGGWVVVDGDKDHHTVAVKYPDGARY
ncbi:hypothetical protein BJV82DRAFT_501006, partial [Fennellomyces sp. T-0311]